MSFKKFPAPWLFDRDGDTWKWCDCGDPEHDGYAYCPDGVWPFDGHKHLARSEMADLEPFIGEAAS
jgi:hypothetical protein